MKEKSTQEISLDEQNILNAEDLNNEGLQLIESLTDVLLGHPGFQRAAAIHFFCNIIRN